MKYITFYYTVLALTILTPVPNIFSTITSPTFIGAVTVILSNSSIISNIIPFGIESAVFTGSKFKYEPFNFTVVVITLLGLVNSSTPYFSPLLQVFPSTLYPFSYFVTLSGHPIGQTIQVILAILLILCLLYTNRNITCYIF